MGDDFSRAIAGKGEKQTSEADIDQIINEAPPTGAGYDPEKPVDIREVQARLAALGYRPGPIDGVFGQKTSSAIAAFQKAQGLPIDGRPTNQLLTALRSRTGGTSKDAEFLKRAATGLAALVGAGVAAPVVGGAIALNAITETAGTPKNPASPSSAATQLQSMLSSRAAPNVISGFTGGQHQYQQLAQNGLANLEDPQLWVGRRPVHWSPVHRKLKVIFKG